MSLFRKSALEKLSSPDNLDEAIVAASPYHWVAFLSAFLVVAGALAWGFLGSVPTRVRAEGILLHHGSEIYSASAEGNGKLITILVGLGDRVIEGQTVAELNQNVDVRAFELAEENLVRAERRLADLRDESTEDRRFRADFREQQAATIRDKIANAGDRLRNLESLVADTERLYERGFVQRTQLLERQNDLASVREQLADLRNSLVELDQTDRRRAEEWREKIEQAIKEVEEKADEIQRLQEQLRRVRTVDAPITGTVTEISASLGDVVSPGTPVVRIVSEAAEMEALLFVPPADGKLVKTRMAVNVEPSVAKKEEFGTILADIYSVSDLPMSASAIQAMLHNEKLVEQFTKEGSPVAVHADLREAPEHVSGFRWSGGRGPDFDIEPGTLVKATITVRRQAPVTLILPFLRSLVGL